MILQVRKGDTWAGGIDKPFVVSWAAIRDALQAMGLRLVDHFERGERPLPFDPSKLRPYSDDWDHVALVEVERGQEIDVPDRVKWVRLMDRVAHRASANPAELAGIAAGESAELAADAATRRAAERRAKASRAGTITAIALVSSGLVVPGVVVLARRRKRRRY